jgi:FixJ family two-component response regulator
MVLPPPASFLTFGYPASADSTFRQNLQKPIRICQSFSSADTAISRRAMKAGAVEFLTKPFREQDLLDAVQLALQRDRNRRIQESAILQTRTRFEALTRREQEVFGLVTTGLMNKQVAGELGVSEITAKVHRGNVMRKMGARSLADLVRMADALGIRQAKH